MSVARATERRRENNHLTISGLDKLQQALKHMNKVQEPGHPLRTMHSEASNRLFMTRHVHVKKMLMSAHTLVCIRGLCACVESSRAHADDYT